MSLSKLKFPFCYWLPIIFQRFSSQLPPHTHFSTFSFLFCFFNFPFFIFLPSFSEKFSFSFFFVWMQQQQQSIFIHFSLSIVIHNKKCLLFHIFPFAFVFRMLRKCRNKQRHRHIDRQPNKKHKHIFFFTSSRYFHKNKFWHKIHVKPPKNCGRQKCTIKK